MLSIDELIKPIDLNKNAKKYSDEKYTWTEIDRNELETAMFDLYKTGILINSEYGNDKKIRDKINYLLSDMYHLLRFGKDHLKYDSYLIKRIVVLLSNFPRLILRDIDSCDNRTRITSLISKILTIIGVPESFMNIDKLETTFRIINLDSKEETNFIRSLPREEDDLDLDRKYTKRSSKPTFNFYERFEKIYRPNNIYYDLKLNSKSTISFKLDKNGKLYYGFKKKKESK